VEEISRAMMTAATWATSVIVADASTLGALRLHPGVEVAEIGAVVWLRGRPASAELESELKKLPTGPLYDLLAGGRLRIRGQRVPDGLLPRADWKPLDQWLKVCLPPAAYPGQIAHRVPLRLVRSDREQRATVFLTNLRHWIDFAVHAPEVRLKNLAFAVAADQQVVVRGFPPPSMPGQRFVDHGGVAVPVGFGWMPAVDPEVLRQVFNVADGALILWLADGTLTEILAEQFVAATRSAARLSAPAGGG
jgi:hypothetical protein